MKLIHIVGARPNFIKLWPVYEAAKKRDIEQVVVHTGQHYDYEMSEMFFEELSLPKPDVNLNVGSGSHAWQTGLIMLKLEDYLKEEDRRAVVVVYGDVNSTLAAAVTAAKLNFKIAHVEAGIRSWDNTMPEEINRKVVDEISDYRFCPSEVARSNINGSWQGELAINVGDVTYDAFLWAQDKLGPPKSTKDLRNDHILVTIHRERNTEPETFRQIEDAITNIGEAVFWPRHPRTANPSPISYFKMLARIRDARLIITDSGGIQKESFWFGKPCIVVRNSTEWPELVESGWNSLVEPGQILRAAQTKTVGNPIENPYGDGKAAEKMVNLLAIVKNHGGN